MRFGLPQSSTCVCFCHKLYPANFTDFVPGSLITTQPLVAGKPLTPHQIAILRQQAAQQQQLQKLQQQRYQQQKQLKLIQQSQQQQQSPAQQTQQSSQTSKQAQPTIVATSNQLGKQLF